VCTTINDGDSLVYMVGRNFLRYNVKGTKGLGVTRRSSKMPCPLVQPNVGSRTKGLVSDGGVASVLGSTTVPSKFLHVGRTARTMGYFRVYALDMAFIEPP